MNWKAFVHRNLPLRAYQGMTELFPIAYEQADEIANREFESNIPYHRGSIRFGKVNDAFYNAGIAAGMDAMQVAAANGLTHTELYSDECVFVVGRVGEPSDQRDAKYIEELVGPNRQMSFFDEGGLHKIEVEESGRKLVQIVHGTWGNNPAIMSFLYVVIPDGNGDAFDYFPLSSVYPGETVGGSGVEQISEKDLGIRIKPQQNTGDNE